jgi:hypothetical protein
MAILAVARMTGVSCSRFNDVPHHAGLPGMPSKPRGPQSARRRRGDRRTDGSGRVRDSAGSERWRRRNWAALKLEALDWIDTADGYYRIHASRRGHPRRLSPGTRRGPSALSNGPCRPPCCKHGGFNRC